jgi:DNA-binding GntR family transcriptional regulator
MILQRDRQLGSQVYEYLRDLMTRQILKPGASVQASRIIQDLGISRTPLRDALIQLQAEGFVTILPQRGVLVNSPTPEDVEYICEILGGLESRVIVSVFHKIGEKEIAEFKRINQEMLALASVTGGDFHEYNDRNIRFHDVFLNLSENELLLRYVRILKQRLYYFPDRDYGRDWQYRNVTEHQQFIQIIEEHNAKQAADFIRDVHWTFTHPKAPS